MHHRILTRTLAAAALITAAAFADDAATTGPAAAIHETFDGAAGAKPDAANWTLVKTAGMSTAKLDGKGALAIQTNTPKPAHRTFLLTKSAAVDPFAAPVRIELKELAVAGEPTGEASYCSAFVVLGRANGTEDHKFYPDGGDMAYGVAVQVRRDAAGKYDVRVDEFSDDAGRDGTAATQTFPLAAAPTGVVVTVDGAKKTLEVAVAGTEFAELKSPSASVTLGDDFTKEHLSADGKLLSRVAVGALNGGASKSGAQVTIGEIEVK